MEPDKLAKVLRNYREPIPARSLFELTVTLVPFVAIWAAAWWMLSINTFLSVLLAIVNAGFLVRTFMIQHDCGHGAFFKDRQLGDWIGRVLGVVTLTPYDVWRRTHSIHHATTGNLDQRGVGDLPTLTVNEYRNKSPLGRFLYRLVRHPLFLFGIVPFYTFFLQNRLPVGLMRSGWRYWVSSQATNAAIGGVLALLIWFGGLEVIYFIFLPTMLLAASIGMWMFYVQHQFEETTWDRQEDWNIQSAALHGSSHYVLPPVLNWITANIGAHHLHHLASRIPFYRLPEALQELGDISSARRLTFRESLRCAALALWDEDRRRLVSFAEARRLL